MSNAEEWGIGEGLPRYYCRFYHDGCRVCDHRQRKGHDSQGLHLHHEPLDEETARAIAKGLNEGTIKPDELADGPTAPSS